MRTYAANVVFVGNLAKPMSIAAVGLSLAGAVLALGQDTQPFIASLVATLAVTALFARGLRKARASRDAPKALLRLSRGDLVVEGAGYRHRVLGSDLAAGWVVPELRGARVVLVGRRGRLLEAWMPATEHARELLGELGLGPLERPVTFAFFFGLRVTVGIDGVLVAWPLLGKRRFIRHDAIDDVRWTDERIALVLEDGSRYEIDTNAKRPAARDAHEALVERLRAAREAYAASEGAEPLAALARGGRSREAWVRELRAMGEASGSQYRSASLPTETLWRIALDASEKEELRIGATLALRAGLDDEGRAKLRVAADAAASPRVRVALGAVADEADDDALADAVAARLR